MVKKELMEKISTIVDSFIFQKTYVLDGFLSLLFWEDYSKGLITPDEKNQIIQIMDAGVEKGGDESWIDWDFEAGLKLANQIRKKIGLPELESKGGIIYKKL